MRQSFPLICASAVTFMVMLPSTALRADDASVRPFLQEFCADCHNADAPEADLDLTSLAYDLADADQFRRWVRIYDRVRSGEMPPAIMGEPDADAKAAFLAHLNDELKAADTSRQRALGRVQARRLTRVEYENTLHHLFGVRVPLQDLLPSEDGSETFATVAQSQQISHFHLDKYLAAADVALDAAFQRALEPLPTSYEEFSAKDMSRRSGDREPWLRGDHVVTWSCNVPFHGRMNETEVRETGWYRVRLRAWAVDPPKGRGVWTTVRSGECASRSPLMHWVGAFEATEEPREFEFDAWIQDDHMLEIRPADNTLRRANFREVVTDKRRREKNLGVPGVAFYSLSMERIHPGMTQEEVRRRLFGNLPLHEEVVEVDRGRRGKEKVTRYRVVSKSPTRDAQKLMMRFAELVFRRPVTDEEVGPYIALVTDSIDAGVEFAEALRGGYRALLCSPRFLYFEERPGPLDDYAVAARLSSLFWSTLPDEELIRLADAGQLRQPHVLHEQVERMLADPRSEQFVRNFTSQWLSLDDIEDTTPDRKLYPEFDGVLQQSMLDETFAFFRELLDNDLSVSNFIDSDFAMLNERLAEHYDIPGVRGEEFRRVPLKPGYRRGGILTQASVLKVTANGTNTSPVVRGAWVAKRLLGETIPPPPPNVPAIEPDIRGAQTIREQLAKHRSMESCASCHVKIDPPGFALENYDVIGAWRDRYRTDRRDAGPVIEAHYELADGRKFEDIDGFKELILSDRRQIARNVVEKLLVYSTGAEITFADREDVETILDEAEASDYGLRSIVHAVVASPIFLTK